MSADLREKKAQPKKQRGFLKSEIGKLSLISHYTDKYPGKCVSVEQDTHH